MKRKLFLKLSAIALIIVMAMSFAACENLFGNKGGGGGGTPPETGDLTPDAIKALNDLADYSKSAADYNAPAKSYSSGVYDGKSCADQVTKLQNRINKKTEDVYLGKSESAVTKIFTKSTPDGILKAIADAALTYDEMVRVVDYIAGEEDAKVGDFVQEIKEEVNGEDVTTGWSGKLTTNSSSLMLWVNAGENGNDLNQGWSFFDDWELYDRLKEYTESTDTNGLRAGDKNKLNDTGTKEISEDNASWQYRSILEKVYTQVDLPGAPAARLATYMLNYAIQIAETMSHGSIADAASAATNASNESSFYTYFKNKVELAKNIPADPDDAKNYWDPYEGLGDYDVLTYLLAFNDFYTKGYSSQKGMQPCAKLYGYYYLYNQTYYNVVLADRPTYTKQLRYEKLDTFNDTEWLDYVDIQRKNYTGSYRYTEAFYQNFYSIHFDFQARKETFERGVYRIENVINGCTYTGEMNKAISKGNNGIKGQLAMSDWTWCYGGSEKNMKDYNKANTGYQEGKNKNKLGTGTKEGEYEGQFYYEFEELKIAHYLLNNMTTTELSGALYYNCYAYSGSLISEMQNYSKDIVLITDKIKDYTEFTTVPDSAGVKPGDKTAYAKEKLAVLRMQAKNDWTNTGVDKKAEAVKSQPWADMRTELQDAKDYEYTKVKSDDTKKGDWQVRCECLEDRVIARIYSCCGQRVSEAKSSICGHATNPDGSKVTKDYDTKQKISKFASDYENVLMYMATRTQVEFQTPEKGYQTQGSARSYVTGYYGDIAGLISEVSTGADVSRMTYSEQNTITMKIGASFDDEVDGDDRDWWLSVQVDSERNANEKKDTDFGPFTVEETSNGAKITYKYTYDFQGWFLDQECEFVFNPEDDVDFNLVIYAGYKVTKTKIS